MEKPTYAVGDRVEKVCVVCNEYRGHTVATVTKRGSISRVSCPKCGTRSSFAGSTASKSATPRPGVNEPYDRRRIYRTGQMMVHPIWGQGEVIALIEPRKIDVLFSDRLRRLIHSRVDA